MVGLTAVLPTNIHFYLLQFIALQFSIRLEILYFFKVPFHAIRALLAKAYSPPTT